MDEGQIGLDLRAARRRPDPGQASLGSRPAPRCRGAHAAGARSCQRAISRHDNSAGSAPPDRAGWSWLFSSARSGDGSNRCGAAGTHGERTAGSDIRTSGRTSSPSDDPAMASLPRRGKLTVACLRSPPRSPSPNHPSDVAGNPDASRCFVGRDSDRPAPHGSPDRGGWPDSAARPRAGRRAAPSVHNLVRSKSGRDHSGCRRKPELGSARTETAGRRRRRRQQRTWTRSAMTGILPRHACSARCGARRRSETWPLRSAPCRPRQSGKFLPRAKQVAQAAISARAQACGFVDNAKRRCPQTHRPNNSSRQSEYLEISSVRTTPGSHSEAALKATRNGPRPLPPSIRGS